MFLVVRNRSGFDAWSVYSICQRFNLQPIPKYIILCQTTFNLRVLTQVIAALSGLSKNIKVNKWLPGIS